MAYAPVLTAVSDMNPSPRVQVVFETLADDTASVTVYQSADKLRTVADAVRAYAVGAFTVVDYMPPGGVVVSYYAEMFDANGASLGVTDTASTTVTWDKSKGVFSDPSDPSAAVMVELIDDFAGTITRGRSSARYQVGDRTVSLSGPNSLITGLSLHCQTRTDDEETRLQEVLSRPVIAVRTMGKVARIPGVLLGAVDSWDEIPVDMQYGGQWAQFDFKADEVSMTRVSIVIPFVTWQQYIDAFPTWADFEAAYDTWLDAMRNPPGGV